MQKINIDEIELMEPALQHSNSVMRMRQEFLSSYCKFNGTGNLELYNKYIDWLTNAINNNHLSLFNNVNFTKLIYLVFYKTQLIGMLEIVFYYNYNIHQQCAHIIQCIRPSSRRQGYGKPLLKKAINECCSLGISKTNISSESNGKASNGTMSKIVDF